MWRLKLFCLLCTEFVLGDKIEHVIALIMENRPYDHFFGFGNFPEADGLKGNESNPVDPYDSSKGNISVLDGNASYVCSSGPSQAFSVFCADFFGPENNVSCAGPDYPESQPRNGWVYENTAEAMYPFWPAQIPVKMALASEFALMDRYYASFPGPSTPNHLFIQSGTSAGCTTTGATYHCNGSSFPQKTIYQALEEKNYTWKYYYNDTAWNTFLEWFDTPNGAAGVVDYNHFYAAAESGDLPNFAFILPRQGTNQTTGEGSNDDHPCHAVNLGERLLKDTYEALRASPAWNKTLFIVTYDDAGGFYDHVELVTHGVPKPDNEPSSCPDNTSFTYIGPRLPTMLASPWIPKGTIVHDPQGTVGTPARPFNTSKFEHSSILKTIEHIFGLEPLTKRDAWAASLLPILSLDEPRTDTPLHLPEAPSNTEYTGPATHGCFSDHELTRRHQRRIRHLAKHVDGLSEEQINFLLKSELSEPADAEAWINKKTQQAKQRALSSSAFSHHHQDTIEL
uniref:Phosphoesterase n=1 Tax=Aureoumbra lagunensis TaxID=44058 RepID=A0A7S3NNV7_9STRA|mmetsp:Transcript_12451/g.16760  ORF Transcript_12451/g.16760 Transcript_12451/m.16760 type:complete len:510 (+) Transcript_12451:80-1609(+)